VVPSPEPLEIVEMELIRELVDHDALVVCAGGGGIPVVRENGFLRGVEAVIDKDRASSVLAQELGVDLFAISTDTDYVYLNYKKPDQAPLRRVTLSELEAHERAGYFPAGNMGPKVESVLSFLRHGGKEAVITTFDLLAAAVKGEAGTRILQDARPVKSYEEVEVFTCR
jgi:carbamate kinase